MGSSNTQTALPYTIQNFLTTSLANIVNFSANTRSNFIFRHELSIPPTPYFDFFLATQSFIYCTVLRGKLLVDFHNKDKEVSFHFSMNSKNSYLQISSKYNVMYFNYCPLCHWPWDLLVILLFLATLFSIFCEQSFCEKYQQCLVVLTKPWWWML